MYILRVLATALALLLSLSVFAQRFSPYAPAVVRGNVPLKYPWAGGLNAPQFSAVDLNRDGVPDLHVFDREGNVHLTFLSMEKSGRREYVYAPEYAAGFPRVENWILLRDFNGDAIQDIFAYSDVNGVDGMVVYTGYYQRDTLAFRRRELRGPFGLVSFPLSSGTLTPIYISKVDYPAVDDLDCDGDLDILTFNLAGGYAEFFQNQSVERNLPKDSLLFTLQNACWGGFYESGLSEKVDLAASPGACYRSGLEDLAVSYRHAGSTLLTLDLDGDGDRELVLGDVSFNNLNMLTNGGSCKQSWMTRQDNRFPAVDNPVDLPLFPAAYHLDVDQDGRKDLLVSPSSRFGSEDRACAWFYANTGTERQPRFQLVQKDFLSGEMLDLGTVANPTFADVNADGRLDLIVGNLSVYDPAGKRDSRLWLFENKGTAKDPRFELSNDDWLGLKVLNDTYFGFAPAFGDIDQDGDSDLLIGEEGGRLIFLENKAGKGNPMQFAAPVLSWSGIDIGLASTPQFFDVDGDGLNDLVVGERSGNVNYFRNMGTKGQPRFNSTPGDAFWGGIDTRLPGYVSGYSAPVVFASGGVLRVLTGTEDLGLSLFSRTAPAGNFSKDSIPFTRSTLGFSTRPALGDLDGDGYLEMAVGNNRGGIQLFRTPWEAARPTGLFDLPDTEALKVFPNPVSQSLFFEMPEVVEGSLTLHLFDLQGRLLKSIADARFLRELDVSALPAGSYVLRLVGSQKVWVAKVMKDH